eukprot:11178484-Lingulodinium_polyedra.AAC.1
MLVAARGPRVVLQVVGRDLELLLWTPASRVARRTTPRRRGLCLGLQQATRARGDADLGVGSPRQDGSSCGAVSHSGRDAAGDAGQGPPGPPAAGRCSALQPQ